MKLHETLTNVADSINQKPGLGFSAFPLSRGHSMLVCAVLFQGVFMGEISTLLDLEDERIRWDISLENETEIVALISQVLRSCSSSAWRVISSEWNDSR